MENVCGLYWCQRPCSPFDMIAQETIAQAVRTLVETARPLKVVLFGSYARGDAREDSDVDFLVIEDTVEDKAREMVRLRRCLRPLRIPVDVLVFSAQEVANWGQLPGTIVSSALREGRVVYG